MAIFSMRVSTIGRSSGRSIMAAVAYRSGEKIYDQRQNMVHDYSRRGDVERTEMMFPTDAPAWVQGITREQFWNRVDAFEKRKDAQTARELRLTVPREFSPEQRVEVVHDYVTRCFVSRGMVADIAWHNKISPTDHLPQPHCHILLTQRPLCAEGFGPKSRHEYVPDPSGSLHPDGRPMLIESNDSSWNSAKYYERCREDWENTANLALARIGSAERIDRRSLLERGLARLPEPALRLAAHLAELKGVMRERFGIYQMAKHYQAVEKRAKAAFRVETDPAAELAARAEARAAMPRREETPAQRVNRFVGWIERQIARLPLARSAEYLPVYDRGQPEHRQAGQERPSTQSPTPPDMER